MVEFNDLMKYLALATALSGLIFSIIFLSEAIITGNAISSSATYSMITFLTYIALLLGIYKA